MDSVMVTPNGVYKDKTADPHLPLTVAEIAREAAVSSVADLWFPLRQRISYQ